MNPLNEEVQEFQERWNSMLLDITEDARITCDEAYAVRKWLTTERRAYRELRRRLNAEVRGLRADYSSQLAALEDSIALKELRVDLARILMPYRALLLTVDEMRLKADELEIRMDRLIRQCEEAG